MYHSYFRTSLFCNCRKPYWNWAYTFLNCTWWMTKPGHIFKIFPLLGLRTLHFGSWISLLFKICKLFPTFQAYPTRIWITLAFEKGNTKWEVGATFLWYSYPLYSYFSREYSFFPENNAAGYDECCLKYFSQDTQQIDRVFYIDGNRN